VEIKIFNLGVETAKGKAYIKDLKDIKKSGEKRQEQVMWLLVTVLNQF